MTKGAAIDGRLTELLDQMLSSAAKITARSVSRRLGVAASTITRSGRRRELLVDYQKRQEYLVAVAAQADPLSRERLVRQIADRDSKIAELTRLVQILTASHKALLIAVGELGGTAAWQRFFANYEQIRGDIGQIGASSPAVLQVARRERKAKS